MAVKYPWILIKDQREKKPISLPHGQQVYGFDGLPDEISFRVAGKRCSTETFYYKNKPEPVFAFPTKTSPVYGSPEDYIQCFDTRFLMDLSCEASNDILVPFHLATQTIVFAVMMIVFSLCSVNKQRFTSID